MSLDEIRAVHEAVDVPLESFVHGALCVSYSGDCQASYSLKGRSANRGECAQICRLPFDLYDGAGNCRRRGQHLLSLRDLNLSDRIESMLDAGVSSFKIEGRLKDGSYGKRALTEDSRVTSSTEPIPGCRLHQYIRLSHRVSVLVLSRRLNPDV